MSVDLERLRTFVTVADTLSFTRAAERLHMSQSPLSRRIRGLEVEVGVRLFDRTTRDVQLTPAGRALYDQAIVLLDSYTAAIASSRGAALGDGSLAIGFGEAWHNAIPQVVHAVVRRFPSISLRMTTRLPTTTHVELLASRRLDVGLMPLPIGFKTSGLTIVDVGEHELVAAIPEDKVAGRSDLLAADLGHEDLIDYPASTMPIIHSALETVARAGEFEPRVRFVADGIQVHLALVAAGLGLSIVPRSAIPVGGYPGVTFLSIRDIELRSRSAIAYSDINRNPMIAAYVECVHDLLDVSDSR